MPDDHAVRPELFDRYFEEYTVGETEQAGSIVITKATIGDFAQMSGDRHPAHTDEEFAAPRFGGVIAHGVLTFAVVVGLTVEYNRKAVAYGYDRIRFPAPVLDGDVVTAVAEVIEVSEHARNPRIGLVRKRYTGTNQHGKTVLACEHILAVDRRS
ncbi:MAG: MaoC family dehydratase [Mycobacterium sp.]